MEEYEKDKCLKCGSEKLIENARITDRGKHNLEYDIKVEISGDPNALVFKDTVSGGIRPYICGECGFVELYCGDYEKFWEVEKKIIRLEL